MDLHLAFNISPRLLKDLTLPAQIRTLTVSDRLPLEHATIEITESAMADNIASARRIAEDLKAIGCRIARDDFGTGYSCLYHLKSLPFDELKVDRSFVSSMATERKSRKIVAAVVTGTKPGPIRPMVSAGRIQIRSFPVLACAAPK